jgi:hypothetical protein
MLTRKAEQALIWEKRLTKAMEEISWKDARSISVAPLRVDQSIGAPESFDITTG